MMVLTNDVKLSVLHQEYLKHYELAVNTANDVRKKRAKGYSAMLLLLVIVLISPEEFNFLFAKLKLSEEWAISLIRIATTAYIIGMFWEITAKEYYINVRYQYINDLLEIIKNNLPEINKVSELIDDQKPMISILRTKNWTFPISDLSVPLFLAGYGIILVCHDLLASIALMLSAEYFGLTVPRISEIGCHFKRPCNFS